MSDWHFINLLVPPLLPVVLLLTLYLFDLSGESRLRVHPLVAVKDGQLCWAAMVMCVNALYELKHPLAGRNLAEPWSTHVFWMTVFCLLFCGVIAAVGPIFPVQKCSRLPLTLRLWHYRVLIASLALTSGSALLYSNVHSLSQC